MSSSPSIKEQFRRNTVALISLAVAITSLGYNTWRNEASEGNRNQRLVSIQILVMLGGFQQVILDRRHGKKSEGKSVERRGWALSKTILDISMVADGDVPESAQQLHVLWGEQFEALATSPDAQKILEDAVDAVRQDVHELLLSLD